MVDTRSGLPIAARRQTACVSNSAGQLESHATNSIITTHGTRRAWGAYRNDSGAASGMPGVWLVIVTTPVAIL